MLYLIYVDNFDISGSEMQKNEELHVVRFDLAAKKNSGDLKRAREALRSRRVDFGRSLTFAWYPKVVKTLFHFDTL